MAPGAVALRTNRFGAEGHSAKGALGLGGTALARRNRRQSTRIMKCPKFRGAPAPEISGGAACGYSPVKLVGRFSRKAVIPSLKSLLLASSPWIDASRARCSAMRE